MKPSSKLLSAIYLSVAESATGDYKAINPQAAKIVSEMSNQRIGRSSRNSKASGHATRFRLKTTSRDQLAPRGNGFTNRSAVATWSCGRTLLIGAGDICEPALHHRYFR